MRRTLKIAACLLLLTAVSAACTVPSAPIVVPGELSDDVTEQGLLSVYDTNTGLLSYHPVELVAESDAQRIEELRTLGEEPVFTDGCCIRQTSEMLFSFPVAKAVTVRLLDDASAPQESDMAAVTERLGEHPARFLCELHIVDGEITGIEEVPLP